MVIPMPRNAVDRQLPYWSEGKVRMYSDIQDLL
jgi:hypothetical protein